MHVDELAEALAQLVLAGADLGDLVGTIGEVLKAEVAVTTTDGRERAARVSEPMRARLTQAALFDETGRLRVEWLGDWSGGENQPVEGAHIHRLPVATPAQALGHLVAVVERDLDEIELTALQRAATAVALSITRDQAVSAVENKYRGDFLRDIFLNRAGSEEFVREHVVGFGWEMSGPMVVVVAQIDPAPPYQPAASVEDQRGWQERFANAWRQVASAVDRSIPIADFGSEVVAVLSSEDPEVTATTVRRMVHAVAGDKGGGRRPFSAGVGRVAAGVGGLPESYAQARRAVEVGRRVRGGSTTTWFDELGLHRLIAMVPDNDELRAFAYDVLGELAQPTEEAATLRETLQVLLNTNFNVAEAARTQFFHYNTMRYRVGKLERLLGPIASDQNLRLDVAVALKVLEVVEG
ncbi:MAG: helix-turn-helix domain-containing protein [Nocardioidaceae bacterium]|nr:helix-turn-helix domain-containing protein [Nocardioidaceae bacterium]